jgi:acetyl-CoA carboxylase biotin carboxyl carrier protein
MSADPKQRPRPVKEATPLRSTRGGAEAVDGHHANGSAGQPGPGQLMLDLDFVRGLITAVDESGIDSLEINRAGTRIRISKSPTSVGTPLPVAPPGGAAAVPATSAALAASAVENAAAEAAAAARTKLIDIPSPMVGTFYRAPAAEAPSYVEVGAHVSKGQTLCILEAMKLMNELDSDVDGIVREILAENADPVEYGQVLFRIEPLGAGE